MNLSNIVFGFALILIGVINLIYIAKERDNGKKNIPQLRMIVLGVGAIILGLLIIFC